MSYSCLTPNEQYYSHIMERASCIRLDDDNIHLLLDQYIQLDLITLAHIKYSLLVDMSTRAEYSDSEPSSLCSYSIMFFAYREATHAKFIVFRVTRLGVEPTIYCTLTIMSPVLMLCVFSLTIKPYNHLTHPFRRDAHHSGETMSYVYTRCI